MLSCLHPGAAATGPMSAVAAHAVGRERWAELMVIKKKKTKPIPSGIFTPCRSGRKADFFLAISFTTGCKITVQGCLPCPPAS